MFNKQRRFNNYSHILRYAKFTAGQANLNRYDLLKQLSGITGIKDIDKLDDFTDALLDNIKKNTNVNASDGLSKEELFQAVNDLKRPQQA